MKLKKIEELLSKILFLGVILSSLLIVFAIIFGNNKLSSSEVYIFNFDNMWTGLMTLDTAAYYMLGIFILILTPIIRVLSMKMQFLILKNYKYVIISCLIVVILSISLIMGVTH